MKHDPEHVLLNPLSSVSSVSSFLSTLSYPSMKEEFWKAMSAGMEE
jgi:hypothetical protein